MTMSIGQSAIQMKVAELNIALNARSGDLRKVDDLRETNVVFSAWMLTP